MTKKKLTKGQKTTSTLSAVVLATIGTWFCVHEAKKHSVQEEVVAKVEVDSDLILKGYESLELPKKSLLEQSKKEHEEKVASLNKIREDERDTVHKKKLEEEEAERKRQIAIAEEKRKKHEQETKNYAVISRGTNDTEIAQQAQEYKRQQQQQIAQQSGTSLGTFQVTGYGADCVGCSGITAAGIDVRGGITHYQGYRVIATDPSVIPMFSIVNIEGVGNCIYLFRRAKRS